MHGHRFRDLNHYRCRTRANLIFGYAMANVKLLCGRGIRFHESSFQY
ncbi:putative transposase [Photobacterium leiognathi lrivu.4.1]|uniref:Putative transposase n=1 Tax=Photobacterium leiognathi lrivu.4.1 TaxID=1248232 RepID=V5F270_PHOLE|nr:putative transposase [Photobacterium leiognathi lrivu.4.1]